MVKWDNVTRAHVLRAMKEYDRLGPEAFFSDHGFGPTTTYDLLRRRRTRKPGIHCQGSTGSQETLSTATDTCPSPFLLSGAGVRCGLGESSASSTSGAGATANRHPVRSGQQADGRNRNENPVAGRGPAPDAPLTTCPTHGAHQTLTSPEFAERLARRP